MDFTNKVVIVTGATGGLGTQVVRTFLDRNATLAAIARSQDKLDALQQEMGNPERLTVYAADLTQESEVQDTFHRIESELGAAYALIHAAGGFQGGKTVAELSLEDWNHILDLNLKAAFLSCKHALKQMTPQGRGKIISISALAALDVSSKKGGYIVSKAGLNALIRAIAEEGKASNIQANAIAPSIILTADNKKYMPDMDWSKWVTPQQIAETAAYLCSSAADSVSGSIIRMPGGM